MLQTSELGRTPQLKQINESNHVKIWSVQVWFHEALLVLDNQEVWQANALKSG